jgi:hypothetical protein
MKKAERQAFRLKWTARVWLLASAIGILVASYYFYQPRNYPFSMDISPQAGQTLLYGGFVLAIAGFAWRWPAAGGIVAIFYSIYKIFEFWSFPFYPKTLIPTPAFYLLYGAFIIGGILNLLVGLRRKSASHPEYDTDKRLRWTARITAFAPIVLTVIVYTLVYPSWFIFGAVPGLVTAGIAWFWPAPGGFLMLLLAVPGFYNLFESNYDFQMKLPAYILCLVFIASGFLHLIMAWRGRSSGTR